MKRTICLMLVLLSVSAVFFANDNANLSKPVMNLSDVLAVGDTPKAKEKEKVPPLSYGYGKFGTSFLFQNFGFGKRYHNFANYWGQDLSFNVRLLWMGINGVVIPNIRYEYLFYRKDNISYFGVGGEVGCSVCSSLFAVYPNVELIWGQEREKVRFTQFSINLAPAAFALVGIAVATTSDTRGYGIAFALAGLAATFEYTIGF